MVFAHRVAPVGTASAGWLPVPSSRLAFGRPIHLTTSLIILILAASGLSLDSPMVTTATCVAILLLGLPHGTFDLALIKRAHSTQRSPAIVALYLFCGIVMYAVWQSAPEVALLTFFVLSIIHFAEDWKDSLPPFLAHGTATALLSAPVLLHQEAIGALFARLVGNDASGLFVALAVLIAPVTLAIAAVATVSLWIDQRQSDAAATAMALCALIFLPPVVGFGLFFCLMHSPAQFAAAQRDLDWINSRQWAPAVVPLTFAALGIAALIFAMSGTVSLTDTMIVTAFVTLSVLTLPHIVVPMMVNHLSCYRLRSV